MAKSAGVNHSSFSLESPRGGRIFGDLRFVGLPPFRSAVVVAHGFKGFKDWGFFPHLCTTLAAAGHAVVSFNFSHNGIGPDPEVLSELEAFSRNTFTRELDELLHVLARTDSGELLGGPTGRVGLLGHSRGGACSILAAAESACVEALVTWGAVDHLDRWTPEVVTEWEDAGVIHVLNQRTGQQLPLSFDLWRDFQENRERLDVHSAAATLQIPWLVVHGKEDGTVSVEEGERLARIASSATAEVVEGAGHTFEAVHPFKGPTDTLDRALERSLQHFHRHLGGDGGCF